MVVATHNPSSWYTDMLELKVPHGHFKVEKFIDGKFVLADASVACNTQEKEYSP
jgi:hypothetical protein